MIKYIGSKRTLVPLIRRIAARLPVTRPATCSPARRGSARRCGASDSTVHSNDLATYSEVLGQAYIAAGESVDRERLAAILGELSGLEGRDGYFTEAFCRRGPVLPARTTDVASTRSATRSTATR